MKYTLILRVERDEERNSADVSISFPQDAYFSTHAKVANALSELLPLLLGEALQRLESEEIKEFKSMKPSEVKKIFEGKKEG